MKIDLQQNTWSWFQYRQQYVNASEIGTIMVFNPFETKDDLIKKKLFGSKFPENEAMLHGKKTEPKANLFFSVKQKSNYVPTVFVEGIFSASVDGYDEGSNTILEIKCPLKKTSNSWKEFFQNKTISPYYWAQIQCGLYCSQALKAYFLVYMNESDYDLQEVTIDHNFIEEMKIKGQQYFEELTHYKQLLKGDEV